MATKYALKWTNKHSGEQGFVESISSKDNCFHNTFSEAEAKRYNSESIARRMITTLCGMGEADNNDFEIIEVAG